MAQVLEPHFQVYIGRLLTLFPDQVMRFPEPSLLQPAIGGSVEDLFKIPFESSQASARQISKPVQMNIEFIMLIHIGLQVDLPRLTEIEQRIF